MTGQAIQSLISFETNGLLRIDSGKSYVTWGPTIKTIKADQYGNISDDPSDNKHIYVQLTRALAEKMNGKTFKFVEKDLNHFWSPSLIKLIEEDQKG